VNASRDIAAAEIAADIQPDEADFDLEALSRAQYQRIAGVIVRVVRDSARAEGLAVEVFLKLSRDRKARGENADVLPFDESLVMRR
jgi:DNA-directed RNA polymerase specialized sigma24 family protein